MQRAVTRVWLCSLVSLLLVSEDEVFLVEWSLGPSVSSADTSPTRHITNNKSAAGHRNTGTGLCRHRGRELERLRDR